MKKFVLNSIIVFLVIVASVVAIDIGVLGLSGNPSVSLAKEYRLVNIYAENSFKKSLLIALEDYYLIFKALLSLPKPLVKIDQPKSTVEFPFQFGEPNGVWQHSEKDFKVLVNYNQEGYRVVPLVEGQKNELTLFYGGSFTFGWGSEDKQTIPASYANLNPDEEVYNFGIPGGSYAEAVTHIFSEPFERLVLRRSTRIIYLLKDNHLIRAVGGAPSMSGYLFDRPHLVYKDKNLYYARHSIKASPRIWALKYWISRFSLFRLFDAHFDQLFYSWEDPKLYNVFCKTFEKIETRLSEVSPESQVIIVAFNKFREGPYSRLSECLSKKVALYRLEYRVPESLKFLDSHPMPQANKKIAQEIDKIVGGFD